MNKPPVVTPEQEQILSAYELGLRLQDTLNSLGWKDLLDIMEKEVSQAEFCLMNYNGTSDPELSALHRRARTMREFFQNIQSRIVTAVEAVDEIKAAVENPHIVTPTGTPGESW